MEIVAGWEGQKRNVTQVDDTSVILSRITYLGRCVGFKLGSTIDDCF